MRSFAAGRKTSIGLRIAPLTTATSNSPLSESAKPSGLRSLKTVEPRRSPTSWFYHTRTCRRLLRLSRLRCCVMPRGLRIPRKRDSRPTVRGMNRVSPVAISWPDSRRSPVQRLFSMLPNGWPGTGLLLLRIASGALLIRQGVIGPNSIVIQPLRGSGGRPPDCRTVDTGCWCGCGRLPSLNGDHSVGRPRSAVLLAAIGAALAMLGPGSRSLDNHFFGRKRFDIPKS